MVREILVEVWSKGEGPSAAHSLEVLHYGLKGGTQRSDRFKGIISFWHSRVSFY
jgi:hypothetical protein